LSPDLTAARRRWSLAAAISSIAVFGIGIGLGAPLLALMLEARGTDASLNGINAAVMFIGVMLGPLLTPRLVQRFGFKGFLLAALPLSLVLFLLLKVFDDLVVWFPLRFVGGIAGSAIFTATEAWISQLAGGKSRGRLVAVYASSLSAGFALGPLVLSITGIAGWPPFIASAVIGVIAMLPLLRASDGGARFDSAGTHPLAMMARMPAIVVTVMVFGMYEGSIVALLPVWGERAGLAPAIAASLLSAVFAGSIALQFPVGWLSDRRGRRPAMRLCAVIGLAGAVLLPPLSGSVPGLFLVLVIWGGFASSLYPIALSMIGDRFGGADLMNANAALIVAYGFGAFIGPVLGGAAMDAWNPHGILVVLALMFAALLAMTFRPATDRDRPSPR
jgi:MFS family permease